MPAAKLIGRRISCRYGHPEGNPIGGFWARCLSDGTIEGTVPDLFMAACGLVVAEIERRGLGRNRAHRFEMEAYDERFTHDTPTTIIEFWLPLEPAL